VADAGEGARVGARDGGRAAHSSSLFTRTLRAFFAALAILLALVAGAVVAGVQLSARDWTVSRNRQTSEFLQSLVLASYRSAGRLDAQAIARATLPYLDESTFLFVFGLDSRIVFAWRRGERLDPGGGGDGGLARNFLQRHASDARPVELHDGERLIGSVAAGVLSFADEAAGQSFLQTFAVVGGAGAAVSFLLAAAVAFLFSSRLSRHAAALADGLVRIAAGERGVRFAVGGARELDQIGESARVLQEKLAEEERLRGQWTADVAHDLRTPLAALRSQLEAMTDGVLPVTPDRLQRASVELSRVEALVADLGELSRIESPGMRPVFADVAAARFLTDLCQRFQLEAEKRGIAYACASDPGLVFSADSHLLHRAATNVLQNAFQHVSEGGRVAVGIGDGGSQVVIRIENTGSIPEEEIPLVFDRLHRGEHSRHAPGSGLGLTIARAVMELHGGSIRIANAGSGTVVVEMILPAARARPAAP
jgi:two-component system, OmpR family, sensor histidine kinase BaeS